GPPGGGRGRRPSAPDRPAGVRRDPGTRRSGTAPRPRGPRAFLGALPRSPPVLPRHDVPLLVHALRDEHLAPADHAPGRVLARRRVGLPPRVQPRSDRPEPPRTHDRPPTRLQADPGGDVPPRRGGRLAAQPPAAARLAL